MPVHSMPVCHSEEVLIRLADVRNYYICVLVLL
jgi:hypothetical protein